MKPQTGTVNSGIGNTSDFDFNPNGEAAKQSVVMTEYGALSMELEVLAKLAEELRIKLEPVLGCAMPSEASGSPAGALPAISPFGESIRSDAARARNIGRELQSLLHRIEI